MRDRGHMTPISTATQTALNTKSTSTDLAINNPQQRPTNGVIFARLVSTAVTTAGGFHLEIDYSEA
jgi:hypothetical protein